MADGLLSIGAFSRASLLSVKALRNYHRAGILVPARVDPDTGYRAYHATQLTDAAVVRRLRGLACRSRRSARSCARATRT